MSNNGSKSSLFRNTLKPNQLNSTGIHLKNSKLKKEMKKFYSKKRRGNFKSLDVEFSRLIDDNFWDLI